MNAPTRQKKKKKPNHNAKRKTVKSLKSTCGPNIIKEQLGQLKYRKNKKPT